MNFNRRYLVLIALFVAGCGGGSGYDGGGSGSGNTPTNPPAAGVMLFVPFVKTQLTQTSDTAEPTDVNDRQFGFDEDETAYDDVLQ